MIASTAFLFYVTLLCTPYTTLPLPVPESNHHTNGNGTKTVEHRFDGKFFISAMLDFGDDDRNGYLTREEIIKFFKNYVGFPNSKAESSAKLFLEAGDNNHDNKLTAQELKDLVKEAQSLHQINQ